MLLTGALAAVIGCGGGAEVTPRVAPAQEVIAPELLMKAWPVVLSNDDARAPFEADSGWARLFERRYAEALAAFQSSGNNQGLARLHQEMAAVYRQGALVAANATHHVYGVDRVASDPVELQYMVGVSRAIRGDVAASQAAFAEARATPGVPAEAWSKWLNSKVSWPPESKWLAARVGGADLGEPRAGGNPQTTLPHYRFNEQTERRAEVAANDPSMLLALSEWHLDAAKVAYPQIASALPLLMSSWRLPVDPDAEGALEKDAFAWLFARSVLCSEDMLFLQAVDATGAGAVTEWADKSPLAAALAPAYNGEKVDREVVLDQSVRLMRQAQAAMVVLSGGEAGHHRPFALFVRLGVLRAGMRMADKAGQYRDAGILRLEALERMEGGKGSVQRDPAFALSVAAWDVNNRSPLRPEDILHNLIPDFPALGAARTPLEALHLRLNRNAAPSTPVH